MKRFQVLTVKNVDAIERESNTCIYLKERIDCLFIFSSIYITIKTEVRAMGLIKKNCYL